MPLPKDIHIPKHVAARAYSNHGQALNGCRISAYSVGSHGYAQIGWQSGTVRRGVTAHRAAWVYVHGQIPEGFTVDHRPTCDKRCVNVDHLRLLTNFENARRTFGRDWPLGECARGHSNEHLYRVGGRLRCRMCKREFDREYKWRNRDRINAQRRARRAV